MSSPEGTQSVRRGYLRKGLVGALTSMALLGSASSACTTIYNGTPFPLSGQEAFPLNDLATRFNDLLGRATAVGMCLIVGDPRLEYPGYQRDSLATPSYVGSDQPPGLSLLAKRELHVPPPTQLFMRIATEERKNHTKIEVRTHMLPDGPYARATEMNTDLLEPDQIDFKQAAVIGVWNPDGSGVELMRDAKGAVSSRDPETEASDVAHPADESDLDNFALYLDGALTGLAAVSSANCQQQ